MNYELWLRAILDKSLLNVMILKAIRDKKNHIIDFEYLFINKNAELSVNRTGLTGKHLLKEFPGSKKSGLFIHCVKVTETGHPWEDEIYYNQDDLKFWTAVKATKLDDGCLVIFSNITEKKVAETELKHHKELLKATLDSSLNYIQVFKALRDEQGKIIDFTWVLQNHIAIKALGELAGKQLLKVAQGTLESQTFERLVRVTETGVPEQAELFYKHENFNNWFYQSIVKLDDGVVTTITDITEQKKREQELLQLKDELQKKATDRYNALFNSIDQGYCTIQLKFDEHDKALDYLFLEVSPSFESQTGLKNAEGKWLRNMVPDQDEFWFEIYGSVALTRKSQRFEYFSTPLKRWWSVYAFPIEQPELRKIGVLFNDITARKKYETEKEELFTKIAHEKAVLDATLKSMPIAVWIADKNGKIIQSNDQAKKVWGESGEYASDIKDYQRFKARWATTGKQLRMEDWAMARALLKGETVVEEEVEILRFDGKKAIILNNAAPIRDERGNIIGGITVAQDITQRKKTEQTIKADEARKEYLLRLADRIRLLDDPVQIQFEAVRTLGEFVGAERAGYAEDAGDGQRVTVTCNYTNGVPGIEGTYSYENYGPMLLHELKAGRTVVREDIANDPTLSDKVKDEHRILQLGATVNKPLLKNGKLIAILFIHFRNKHSWTSEELNLLDETAERTWAAVERARAEESLRKSEENYRQRLEKEVIERTSELLESRRFIQLITDSTPDILFVYDIKNWKIVYVNEGIFTTLGYKPEEAYATDRKGFEQMLHPDDLKRRIREMTKMINLKPGEIRESEFRINDKKGNTHWLSVRDLFFKANEKGVTIQALSICQDVTEKIKAIEAYRMEKNRSEELKRMNELMDTFVFAAAHDLKAPVSNLKMLTQVIENADETDKKLLLQKKYADVVETLDLTISGLVKVLAVEKDSGSGTKTLSFKNVFSKVTDELKVEISEINPRFNIDFSECESIIYIESYLFSIFRNMLTNSLKFKSDNRDLVVDIKSGYKKNFVWLSFSDNGSGIDLDKYSSDLFKPFKRFSSNVRGSGLGLNLIKNIVTKNGGNIEVKSKKSKGTTFTIYMIPYTITDLND